MQASHRVGVVGARGCREISGLARGQEWPRSNGCLAGSTPTDSVETARICGRRAGCRRDAAQCLFPGGQMRIGAHGGAWNACERFTAGFALLLGAFVTLQARTAAAAAALA